MHRSIPLSFCAILTATLIGCQKSTSMSTGSASGGGEASTVDQSRAAASPNDFSTDPIQGDRATLLVYGMSCPLCATNVDQQLLTLPGVSTVNVDLSNGWVTVLLKDGAARPSKRDLARAIVESGMTIVDIQAN